MYPKIPHMMAVRVCDVGVGGREGGIERRASQARAVGSGGKVDGRPDEAVWVGV